MVQITTQVPATAVVSGGQLVAQIPAVNYDRKLTRLRINGPGGTSAKVYMDAISETTRIDNTPYGAENTAEYSTPVFLRRGSSLYVVWNSASGSASATAFFAEG